MIGGKLGLNKTEKTQYEQKDQNTNKAPSTVSNTSVIVAATTKKACQHNE